MSNFNEHEQAIERLKLGELIVISDMSSDHYHQHKGISSSKIKDGMNSMMYFNNKYNKQIIKQPDKDHFCVGRLTHSLILEPHKVNEEYMKMPDTPRPNNTQRERYDRWVKRGKPSKNEYKDYPTDLMIERCEFWDSLNCSDKTLVDKDQWKLANDMAEACKSHPVVKRMLDYENVEIENSYFTRDQSSEMLLKVRPDIKINNVIADIKSVSLRSKPDEHHLINTLRSEVYRQKYHVSAAMYCDVTCADQFIVIFVNKEPGYHWVAVLNMGDKMLNEGRTTYKAVLNNIKTCTEYDAWPAPLSIATDLGDDQYYIIPEL